MGISNLQCPNKWFLNAVQLDDDTKYQSYILWNGYKGGKYSNKIGESVFSIEGTKFSTDDIVSFILDLSTCEIRVNINGNDKAIMFENIVKSDDIKYRLMISLFAETTSVEIVNFQTQYK